MGISGPFLPSFLRGSGESLFFVPEGRPGEPVLSFPPFNVRVARAGGRATEALRNFRRVFMDVEVGELWFSIITLKHQTGMSTVEFCSRSGDHLDGFECQIGA